MKVFISHARNDAILARAVYNELLKYGHTVKLAGTLETAIGIQEAVQTALDECRAMIVLLNPHSYQSLWVKFEVEYALSAENYKKRLLPVFVGTGFDSAPKKTPWILTALRHINLPHPADVKDNAKKVVKEFQKVIQPGGIS